MFSDEYPTPMNILLYCITHLYVIAGIVIFRENVFTAYEAKQMLWSATVYYCAAYSLIIPSVGVAFLFWAIRPNGTLSLLLYAPALWIYVLQPRVLFLPPYNTEIYLWTVQQILKNFSGGVPPVYYIMMSVHIGMFILALGSIMRPILSITRALGEETQDFVLPTGMGGKGRRLGRHTAGLPDAKWATPKEVRTNFSTQGGIVLGELTDPRKNSKFDPRNPRSWKGQGKGELITLDPLQGNGHVLVTSQAGGFKTAGIVIPNLLNYNGPVVVFDPKCEVYARTREARENMGFQTVVIDGNNGFDPARLIARLASNGHDSAYHRMASLLISKSLNDHSVSEYFKSAAIALLTALIGYYAKTDADNIIDRVSQVLRMKPEDAKDLLDREMNETGHKHQRFILDKIQELESTEPKFFESVKTEITNVIMFNQFEDVRKYTVMRPNSPLIHQMLEPNTDIFLNIPQHIADDFAPMIRLMLGSFLMFAEMTETPEAPRARRLFLIDEAAKLGRMDILANLRDRGRAYGLHLMMFYQTPGEIAKIWGEQGMQSWRDGCSATIMGPVSAQKTATELSTMIGKQTLRLRTKNQNTSNPVMSPFGGTVGSGEVEQLRDVPLITPTEITQLPNHASIITALGHPTMLATKAIYFTRRSMKNRVWTTEQIQEFKEQEARKHASADPVIDNSCVTEPAGQNALNTSRASQAQSQAQSQALAPTHPDPAHQATSEAPHSKEAAAQYPAHTMPDPSKRVEFSLDKLSVAAEMSHEHTAQLLKDLRIPEPYEWKNQEEYNSVQKIVLRYLHSDRTLPDASQSDAPEIDHTPAEPRPEEPTLDSPEEPKNIESDPVNECNAHENAPQDSPSNSGDNTPAAQYPTTKPHGDKQANAPRTSVAETQAQEPSHDVKTQDTTPEAEPTRKVWMLAVVAEQTNLGFDDWKAAQETQEPQ